MNILMRLPIANALILATALVLPMSADSPAIAVVPSPKTDARGFVDVWRLRDDLARVDALAASDDTDGCYEEGDPDERPPTVKEARRREQTEKACVLRIREAYSRYKAQRDSFNSVWLPVLYNAIRNGDHVAEVIMRHCETTPVLDRMAIETTCDTEPRRKVARRRLEAIGFIPALGLPQQITDWWESPDRRAARELNQKRALQGIGHGVLSFDRKVVLMGNSTFNNYTDREAYVRAAVIEAAIQDAPRAFTFVPESLTAGWNTGALADLRLNRQATTPGYLTWGRALHFGGNNSPWTGPRYWRSNPPQGASGSNTSKFQTQLNETLANAEASIERYLKHDPRWGVFLLRRVGHHEWVPEGTRSKTHELAAEWQGTWLLEKAIDDWTEKMGVHFLGEAVIRRNGDLTQITTQYPGTDRAFPDVTDCTLRYSGGNTYLPKMTPQGQAATATLLGYFYANGPAPSGSFRRDGQIEEAVAPFDPKKRYKQVLMQCDGAESANSDRLRFLLLAGDVLVEFSAEAPFGKKLAVRHFRRADPEAIAAEQLADVLLAPSADDAALLRFDGVYRGENQNPHGKPVSNVLRFYPDGRVISHMASGALQPEWFTPETYGMQVGTYRVRENAISFNITAQKIRITHKGVIDGDVLRMSWNGRTPAIHGTDVYTFVPW